MEKMSVDGATREIASILLKDWKFDAVSEPVKKEVQIVPRRIGTKKPDYCNVKTCGKSAKDVKFYPSNPYTCAACLDARSNESRSKRMKLYKTTKEQGELTRRTPTTEVVESLKVPEYFSPSKFHNRDSKPEVEPEPRSFISIACSQCGDPFYPLVDADENLTTLTCDKCSESFLSETSTCEDCGESFTPYKSGVCIVRRTCRTCKDKRTVSNRTRLRAERKAGLAERIITIDLNGRDVEWENLCAAATSDFRDPAQQLRWLVLKMLVGTFIQVSEEPR